MSPGICLWLAAQASGTAVAHPTCAPDSSFAVHSMVHEMGYVTPPAGGGAGGGASPKMDPNGDRDGDGVKNKDDAFPNNYLEQVDTDGDGVGDNSDAFPKDAKETMDSDGDGVGDAADSKFDGPVSREVNYQWSDGYYGFTSKFNITSTAEGQFKVTVKIALSGERGAHEATWEKAAEDLWSTDGLTVDVQFVDAGTAGAHATVNVKKGNGRSNAAMWHTADNGQTAAHEIGHILGLTDEYADANDPDRFLDTTGTSVMAVAWGNPVAYDRHTEFIKQLFQASK